MGNLLTILVSVFFVQSSETPALRVVDSFQPDLYLGVWYEVAATKGLITRECVCTRARYELLDNGNLSVLNTCNKFVPRGALIQSRKIFKVFHSKTNGLISKSYRIIEIGSNYEYAIVSDARGHDISVLAREIEMDPVVYSNILLGLWRRGIDANQITPIMHHDCNYPK